MARARPACPPLDHRTADLTRRARDAARTGDLAAATSVQNLSALLASDVGDHELARAWCHQHARTYLRAAPLPAQAARYALEPLVNIARLQTRAGQGDEAYETLSRLYQAITDNERVEIDGIAIPAPLTTDGDAHAELRRWLWAVLLAEGGRALTSLGHWDQALRALRQHHGVGARMLDGRQVAVIACLIHRDNERANDLITSTTPGTPFEDAVTACLAHLTEAGDDTARLMLLHYRRLPASPLTCTTRLGLIVVDALGPHPAAPALAQQIAARATGDGYAARDVLSHPSCTSHLADPTLGRLRGLVSTCALGQHRVPPHAHEALQSALTLTQTVIRDALPAPGAR